MTKFAVLLMSDNHKRLCDGFVACQLSCFTFSEFNVTINLLLMPVMNSYSVAFINQVLCESEIELEAFCKLF